MLLRDRLQIIIKNFYSVTHLILEDDDVAQLHDLHGSQMFRRLWLGAWLIAGWSTKNKTKRTGHIRKSESGQQPRL
jgi:hypothetical protein